MAIRIQSYYKTTYIDEQTLTRAVQSCSDQENKIFRLYQTFGTMTMWDVYDVYNTIMNPILPSSVGRSINTLINQNAIISIGTIPGPNGRPVNLYRLVDNPPGIIKRNLNKSIPKDFKIKILYSDENKLNYEKMIEDLLEKGENFEQTFFN